MTLEEAYALVLREGMKTEPVSDDALPMLLHQGDIPSPERISCLIDAIDTVHEAIENNTVIDKRLAGALWIIGVEANNAPVKDWSGDSSVDLFNAVESALVGFWLEGHPRGKGEVTHGDSVAGKAER